MTADTTGVDAAGRKRPKGMAAYDCEACGGVGYTIEPTADRPSGISVAPRTDAEIEVDFQKARREAWERYAEEDMSRADTPNHGGSTDTEGPVPYESEACQERRHTRCHQPSLCVCFCHRPKAPSDKGDTCTHRWWWDSKRGATVCAKCGVERREAEPADDAGDALPDEWVQKAASGVYRALFGEEMPVGYDFPMRSHVKAARGALEAVGWKPPAGGAGDNRDIFDPSRSDLSVFDCIHNFPKGLDRCIRCGEPRPADDAGDAVSAEAWEVADALHGTHYTHSSEWIQAIMDELCRRGWSPATDGASDDRVLTALAKMVNWIDQGVAAAATKESQDRFLRDIAEARAILRATDSNSGDA